MSTLGLAKRRIGQRPGSLTLGADSTGTLLCAALAGTVLARMVLGATLGWWHVGPLAALSVAWLAVYKGRQMLRIGLRGQTPWRPRIPHRSSPGQQRSKPA